MRSEPFTGANTLMRAPADWDTEKYGPCHDLSVAAGNGIVLSVWRPSKEEAALLMGGGLVLLTVVGDQMPPVQIEVVHARDAHDGMAQG